jgi:H+-transporting ATPase
MSVLSAGDHGVIAKETARMLGLGTNIPDAAGLPTMDADGKIPKDLGKKYGKMILEADGFAQVRHSSVTCSVTS